MSTAHPSLLREPSERCEKLQHRLAAHHSADTARRLVDATYTLCVITGTHELDGGSVRRPPADGPGHAMTSPERRARP